MNVKTGKIFRFNSTLLRHQRRHTGAKPFKCKECGKVFKFSYECIIHEKSHLGEGPMSASGVGSVLTQPQMVHLEASEMPPSQTT